MKYPRHHQAFSQLSTISSDTHYELDIMVLGQCDTSYMPQSSSHIILPMPYTYHISTLSLLHPLRHCQAYTMCISNIDHMGRAISISIMQYRSKLYHTCLLDSTGFVINLLLLPYRVCIVSLLYPLLNISLSLKCSTIGPHS